MTADHSTNAAGGQIVATNGCAADDNQLTSILVGLI